MSSCVHRGSEIPSDIEHAECPPYLPRPWPEKGSEASVSPKAAHIRAGLREDRFYAVWT